METVCSKKRIMGYVGRHKKFFLFLLYSLLFFVLLPLIFFPFIKENRSFVWKNDGLGLYIPNLYSLYNNIIETIKTFIHTGNFALPMFDFSVGLGNDILPTYFTGILEYLGILGGRTNVETVYNIIIIIRLYIAGLSFMLLCKYMKRKWLPSLLASYVYIFSGFSLFYGVRHPAFLFPLVVLPLLIITMDLVIKKKNPVPFIILVAVSLWKDYYFLYMNTLLLAVYFFIRFFSLCTKDRWKNFITTATRVIGYYLIGCAIAMVSFLPKIIRFGVSGRNNATIESGSLLTYGPKWIFELIARLFSPYTTSGYTKYYMLYSVASIGFLAIVILFMKKGKEYKSVKKGVIVLSLFLIFPFVAFVFSGFNSLVNRWSYAYVLIVAYVIALILPEMKELSKKEMVVLSVSTTVFIAICLLVPGVRDTSTITGSIFMVFTTGVICCLNIFKLNKRKYLFTTCMLGIVLLNLVVFSYFIYDNSQGRFVNEFVSSDKVLAKEQNALGKYTKYIKDKSFYRTEFYKNAQHLAGSSKVIDYYGTAQYDSTINGNIIDYFLDMECTGLLTTNNIYDFNSRSYLEALASVKYYLTSKNKLEYVPYGFERYRGKKNVVIYQNENALPLGYTYDSYLNYDEYMSLNSVKKQQALLQSIVLQEEVQSVKQSKVEDLIFDDVNKDYRVIPINAKWSNNMIEATEDGAEVVLLFDPTEQSETYVRLTGFSIDEVSDNSMTIKVEGSDASKNFWALSSKDKYSGDRKNYLVNIGYSEIGKSYCKIILPKKGKYYFDSIEIIAQPTSKLSTYVDALSNEALQGVSIENNKITGRIETKEDKMLCFSIPYSTGWKAYVNGEEVEVIKANTMYMAIPLSAGKSRVTLCYVSPGLKAGMIVSICGIILLLLIIIVQIRKYRVSKRTGVN